MIEKQVANEGGIVSLAKTFAACKQAARSRAQSGA